MNPHLVSLFVPSSRRLWLFGLAACALFGCGTSPPEAPGPDAEAETDGPSTEAGDLDGGATLRDATQSYDAGDAPDDAGDASSVTEAGVTDGPIADAVDARSLCTSSAQCAVSCCGGVCVDTQTDDENCGGCGLACPSGCDAGRCVVTLASDRQSPAGIAVDQENIYWSEDGPQFATPGTGQVLKMPLDGGSIVTMASNQGAPDQLLLAGANLYWEDSYDSTGSEDGQILMVDVDGGLPFGLASEQPWPSGLTADAVNLYYGCGDGIMRLPLAGGGGPGLIAPLRPNQVAVDATSIYASLLGGPVVKIPLDASDDADGGNITTLAPTGEPYGIAVDATSVYWVDIDARVVMKTAIDPVDGGAPVTLASGLGGYFLAIDDTSVYWADGSDGVGVIAKVAKAGGPIVTLASGQGSPWSLAVDATSVYWTNYGSGTLMKVTPK